MNKIAKNPLSIRFQGQIDQNVKTDNFFEITAIENSIIKIANLLILGLGEAGTQIIMSNIRKEGWDINAILRGQKISAIYGFCDIRNFTDTTEILQEEVMIFVNKIANVVHTMVDRHMGAANKNIGDAFLIG